MFYVYDHKKPNGEVFYIGKGKDQRAWSVHGRNPMWRAIVDKHSYSVEIVADNLTEQEAFDEEIRLIALYGRRNNGTGTLANLTDGGEGVAGYICSDETREVLSKKFSRAKNPRADKKEYTFVNLTTGEEITGIRNDVEDKLGFKLGDLFKKSATTVFGWTVKGKITTFTRSVTTVVSESRVLE